MSFGITPFVFRESKKFWSKLYCISDLLNAIWFKAKIEVDRPGCISYLRFR